MALRRRPPSIYEHVRRHVPADGPGLTEGGEELPDEEESDGIRFAPGAAEGVLTRYGGMFLDEDGDEEDDEDAGRRLRAEREERVGAIHAALVGLADRPGRHSRRRLLGLFAEGGARELDDEVLVRLGAAPPSDSLRLYQELRTVFLESGNREEVKWSTVVLSSYRRPEDLELFRTIGRHAEFTRYAALALARVVEDPFPEWLELLRNTTGWGRTEVVELMLEQDLPVELRGEVLRHGLGVGNALDLAVGCRLHELLAADGVDDELLDCAGEILDGLTWGAEQPEGLSDYPEAGLTVERFLEHAHERRLTLWRFVTVHELRRYAAGEPELDDETLERCGLDAARRDRVVDLCDAILSRPGWRQRAEDALEAADEDERQAALAVAKRLGVPLREYLVRRIEQTPFDAALWYELSWGADEETIDTAIALAERVLPLEEIGSGPALDLGLVANSPHGALEFVLQQLPRFPGKGWKLVRAGLRSPVIRHRHIALRAASRWPRDASWPAVEEAVRACLRDPDEEVRRSAEAVLAGEVLPSALDQLLSDGDEE